MWQMFVDIDGGEFPVSVVEVFNLGMSENHYFYARNPWL